MFRKREYLAAGGLDTRFSFCAEVDLYLKLAETSCVAYVPEPLIRRRVVRLFQSFFALLPND